MAKVPTYTSDEDAIGSPHTDARGTTGSAQISTLQSAGIFLAFVTLVLVADSLLRNPGAFEYYIIDSIQGASIPFASEFFSIAGGISSIYFLIAAWVAVLIAAGIMRRWGAMIAASIAPLAAVFAVATDRIVNTRPPLDSTLLERTVPNSGVFFLPAAEVVGAALLFGLVFFLARNLDAGPARTVLQGFSAIAVVLVGLSQLWTGSMWPSEVLSALIIGALFIVPLLILASRVDLACRGIPLISAAEVPHDERKPHAHALTSTIIFNGDTVSKVYRPGFIPRAIYWLAFQAEFPYMRNRNALQAAVHRRNMIGMLTEYWYGSSHVARALGVDEISGRYAITSEFVEGSEPADREAAREFLRGLVERFEEAGLPTWQIDPLQPRATDNVLETEDGRFQVVDLESGLVSPMASLRTWRRALRRGQFPLYDDIFFDVTRAYIDRHEASMRIEMGDAWVRRIYMTLSATESATQAWHDSEPRIWSRILGRRRARSEAGAERQHWAIDWFNGAIQRWHDEGYISSSEARQLKKKVHSPEFLAVMPHFGVHLSTGILLRFPLGSIARASYTTFQLLRVSWKYLRRQISRSEWQQGAGIHSPLVIICAAIPGVGAFSYLASKPIITDLLLLRIGLDAVALKFPFRIYERTRARWIITDAPELAIEVSKRTAKRSAAPLFSWADEHRSASTLDPHPNTHAMVEGTAARSFV